jgi:hypothetical protein
MVTATRLYHRNASVSIEAAIWPAGPLHRRVVKPGASVGPSASSLMIRPALEAIFAKMPRRGKQGAHRKKLKEVRQVWQRVAQH